MKRLSHRFWLWVWRRLEHHRFLENIKADYNFDVDLEASVKLTAEELEAKKQVLEEAIERHINQQIEGLTADHIWEIPVDDEIKSSEPMTFNERITGLGDFNDEQREAARNSEVLVDRILDNPKGWDTPIKKGYDKS